MTFSCLSEEEVRRKYRQADDKEYILAVIADLTCATKKEVKEFLGIPVKPKKPRNPRGPSPKRKFDHAEARKLYDAGLSDKEIAKALGVAGNTINVWRNNHGLPVHSDNTENERRMALYLEGLNDTEIADIVGVNPKAIHGWRRRRGLPPNAKPGGWKNKESETNA